MHVQQPMQAKYIRLINYSFSSIDIADITSRVVFSFFQFEHFVLFLQRGVNESHCRFAALGVQEDGDFPQDVVCHCCCGCCLI